MLSEQSQETNNAPDEFDQLFSMSELGEFDMGKYTMKILPNSNRLYHYKVDRLADRLKLLNDYRQENRFCDAILSVKGVQFPVHKIVLASASGFFASMFDHQKNGEAGTPGDFDLSKLTSCPKALELILDFIYTSEIQLNDKVVRFIRE